MAVSNLVFDSSPNSDQFEVTSVVTGNPEVQVTCITRGLEGMSSIAVALVQLNRGDKVSNRSRIKLVISADPSIRNEGDLRAQQGATAGIAQSGRLITGNPFVAGRLLLESYTSAQVGADIVLGTVEDQVFRKKKWRPLGAFIKDRDPSDLEPFIGYLEPRQNGYLFHSIKRHTLPMYIHEFNNMNTREEYIGSKVTIRDLVPAYGYRFLQNRIDPGVSIVLGVSDQPIHLPDNRFTLPDKLIAAIVTFPQ